VDSQDDLAAEFEKHRPHLRAVAYRMLGSLSEADDAVQEGWLRLSRTDTAGIERLPAWLTTVVSRVCLDQLRARKARREDSLEDRLPDPVVTPADTDPEVDPEQQAMVAEAVGLALLVVLE
jgi:RNA polymerase sigma-70 factor (ECF subfamily)